MIKIVSNHNHVDVTYSYTLGYPLPKIDGKLLRIEISGNELVVIVNEKQIPIYITTSSYLIWHGKNAGHILKWLRELI